MDASPTRPGTIDAAPVSASVMVITAGGATGIFFSTSALSPVIDRVARLVWTSLTLFSYPPIAGVTDIVPVNAGSIDIAPVNPSTTLIVATRNPGGTILATAA